MVPSTAPNESGIEEVLVADPAHKVDVTGSDEEAGHITRSALRV